MKLLALLCLMLSMILPAAAEPVDFAAQLGFNPAETAWAEVTVKTFVDGDTVHFHVDESVTPSGVLKARFLAINTPEITGKVEEWGKKAAQFTKEKLSGADSIRIQSDNGKWNLDSTGDRHLVWVWYRPAGETAYRCLNLEILQNGLAKANATAQNRYGSICSRALEQAKEEKLHLYSGQKDPDFYYGQAVEMTLRELRTNVELYSGVKVAFNGVVTLNAGQTVFVEAHDPETGLYFGMPVYYGFGMSGAGLDILSVGNEVRIVGTIQYYEVGGTWQVSGLTYRMMKPKDPGNIQLISSGHSAAYAPVTAEQFNGTATIDGQAYPYAQLTLGTTVSITGLTVTRGDASEGGEMTLICADGQETIVLRTEPLRENGALIAPERYVGKTIDVKGVVDYFDGAYQIRVLTPEHMVLQ